MIFSIVTIFPGMIENFTRYGLIAKAIEKKLLTVNCYDLREFAANKHHKVDDRPFGGGAGMVMLPQPLFDAVQHIKAQYPDNPGKVILFSAYAPLLKQEKIKELARTQDHLILICGRYEGVDQRFIDEVVDEEISIGDYVLMGGETPAQVLIESIGRMLDGVIGNPESVETDSFYYEDQYGFPQYTQPRDYKGLLVPEVLLSGHHKDIMEWRKNHQKRRLT
ncbi:MAG: tRNA (guanosine(37)-N1)-methyltransferase TrmD [Acidobacteria bacterium]|jgi:tRNA (guanine37-N1)-methyltransferase|nr:tRNA (guanosine(37)-N1)-methyltransferase TrmD [Acidobacteriota bacterium]